MTSWEGKSVAKGKHHDSKQFRYYLSMFWDEIEGMLLIGNVFPLRVYTFEHEKKMNDSSQPDRSDI